MSEFKDYFTTLGSLPLQTIVTGKVGLKMPIEFGVMELMEDLQTRKKTMIVGNGGSASIATHAASHYTRGFRIMSLNDPSAMTATANDFGYEYVYALQVRIAADVDDLLILVSSSGKSPNMLKAAEEGRKKKCKIITFTGFNSRNPLRELGDLNFYVPSDDYGHVELTHMALIHSAFDLMEVGE